MNLTARLLLDTSGFIRPAENALGPLRRVKNELGEVGREAGRVASRQAGGGALALPAAAGLGGVAAGLAPAITALATVRSHTLAVAHEMRRTAAPLADLTTRFRALSIEAGGGGGGRRMINVTPLAAMRGEIVLARQELVRYMALQQLALEGGGGNADGGSRAVFAPIGRLHTGGRVVSGAAGAAEAGGLGAMARGVLRSALPLAGTAAVIGGGLASMQSASRMEDFETSFSTLLGGMDAAQRRMQELARFAQTTPFELPEVAQASRVLETLTRGALSTGDGLRMVGDVAANTGQSFGELAMWIGRTYDGLQSGRPIGEALMRLQELGVMSGETRSRIEALQAEGKRGAEVWGVAASSFARFSGEMERRSATLSGRMSNLKDSAAGLGRELGGPLIAMANDPLRRTSSLLDDITSGLRDVKKYWLEAFGVVPEGAFPAPAAKPAPAPRGAGTEREVTSAINDFFGPLDRIGQARDSIREAMASIADLRAQAVLQNPFASDTEREGALMSQARRAFRESGLRSEEIAPGVRADPQTVEDAMQRVDARLKELEAMREVNAFVGSTAEEMERLNTAYEKLVALAGQVRAIHKTNVDRALEDFFGPLDEKSRKLENQSATRMPSGDRFARMGGFSGSVVGRVAGLVGSGGPSAEHARQTAANTARTVQLLARMNPGRPGAEYS